MVKLSASKRRHKFKESKPDTKPSSKYKTTTVELIQDGEYYLETWKNRHITPDVWRFKKAPS